VEGALLDASLRFGTEVRPGVDAFVKSGSVSSDGSASPSGRQTAPLSA
jgi:hypothetical protein